MQFSFNTGKITPDRMFTLKPGEQSLEDVLIQVKSKTGIYYKTIGSHIVLLDKLPETELNKPGTTTSTSRPVTKKPSVKRPAGKITEKKAIPYPAGGTDQHPSDDGTFTADENDDISESTKKADDYLYDGADKMEAITDSNKTRLTDTARRILAKNHPASISIEKENRKIEKQTLTEDKSFRFFAGGGLVRTAGIRDEINTNLMGWEDNVKAEKRITQNLSATVSFGVAHFTGRYKSKFNRFRSTGDSTIQNFTLTPLLAGFRYRLGSIMYLSAEAGIT
ncbi:MAG TPA: STN domain-containing protein, partial [Sphingobacteriaceae bacterium]